jgi:23S rRNA pseudouridine1911/1915/1917 synthase
MADEIPAALGGERLDRLVSMLHDVSRARASDLVASGAVLVDGAVVTDRSLRVPAGALVAVSGAASVAPELPAGEAGIELEVVHADDDVIVIDKPAGLVVHPGAGNPGGTVVNSLLQRFPEIADVGDPDRPGVVHRLDKGTSGLLAVARSAAGYEGLVAQLSARTVARAYDALAWGVPESSQGMVDAPIGRSRRDPTRMTVAADGREARTRYEVVATFDAPEPAVRLTCRLETGRTHQIRVHLSAIGHPVVGDHRYGGAKGVVALDRPFLHATHLGFTHPVTGEHLAFDSPLPPDLVAVLATFS